MGYYDEPTTYLVTVSFTCKDCGYENEDVETETYSRYETIVECEKCEYENTVEEDEPCQCYGDKCYC